MRQATGSTLTATGEQDARAHRRRGRPRRIAAGIVLTALLALPAAAQANGAPKAVTGNAREIGYATATLTGSVNPNEAEHLLLLPVRPDEGLRQARRRSPMCPPARTR